MKFFLDAFFKKTVFFLLFNFVQNHFWSSEERFFIGRKSKFLIIKVSFSAKMILEFRRKKFSGGKTLI
jgi:hypothetical protein